MNKVVPLFREKSHLIAADRVLAEECLGELARYLADNKLVCLALCAVLSDDEIYLAAVAPSSDPYRLVGGLDDLKRQVHEDRDATFEWDDDAS